MKVKFTPVFNRKNKLNSKGQAPIEIRAYQDRRRKFVSTGIFVTPEQWNEKRLEINETHDQADMLNIQIKAFISNYEQQQAEHIVHSKPFSIGSLNTDKEKIKSGSFVEFVKKELANDQTLRPKTKVSHTNTLNKLIDFKKGKEIFFTDITYTFVDEFLNYLRTEKLAINTIHKQHKNLKRYIDTAIKKGFFTLENPCKQFKLKWEDKKRDVLVMNEIKEIEKADLSKYPEKIGFVRDMFLFSCYTGLRISDVTNLKTSYVKKGKEGYSLEFITIKVNKRAEIPLHNLFKLPKIKMSKPEIILEKYYDKKKALIFPEISEPFINRHLKVIADIAKIKINVTFHTARHTFGTIMATKVPLPLLMVLMQHSDIKTTMVYVNTSQELVKQGLLKVNWD